MKTTRCELLIVGAGPTSLGALDRFYQLQKERKISAHSRVLVIERESEPGGLARSVVDPLGFTWDYGVHVCSSNSRFPAFVELLDKTIPKWNTLKRCIKASFFLPLLSTSPRFQADISHVTDDPNRPFYIPYPVQNSVHYFPPAIRDQCLRELTQLAAEQTGGTAENFAEFTRRTFGPTLTRVFISPYNQKVWTVPMEAMNTQWAEGRVPKLNFEQIRSKCKTKAEEEEDERADLSDFRYPADCKGMGELWRRFAESFPQSAFMFDTEMTSIDLDTKRLRVRSTQSGEETEIRYEMILSTIPLLELNRFCGLFADLKLRYSTVWLVGVGLRKPQNPLASRLSWAYYPRSDVIFYRCTVISNFSDALTPDPQKFWSVLCEIGRRPEVHESSDEIVQRVIQDLKRVQLIESEQQVHSTWFTIIPYGQAIPVHPSLYWIAFSYPIPTLERDEELQKCHDALEEHQIFSRGRFGAWKYEQSNQDVCFEQGRQLVDRLYLGEDEHIV
ncbi:Amino-oxidase domain-containing protein [Aphelenchoides fujianensis]|nr:Amino-oxidase domain-containing protein [Aphelenchoides fujianensis]